MIWKDAAEKTKEQSEGPWGLLSNTVMTRKKKKKGASIRYLLYTLASIQTE